MTKKKAIEISIELWAWLAKTGNLKGFWDGWETHGWMIYGCPLCEYSRQHTIWAKVRRCSHCPYDKKFGCCYGNDDTKPSTIYDHWEEAETPRTRKKYAKLFLEQLKTL